MNGVKSKKTATRSEAGIDELVASEADDNLAWEPPIRVKRPKATSVSISRELEARAALLASLRRETGLDGWVKRLLRERVELEGPAFAGANRELAS